MSDYRIPILTDRIAALEAAMDSSNGSSWVTFVPSWTNVTVGDATTNIGVYRYVPGGMWVAVRLVFGSTTAFTGAVQFTLPNSETSADLVATPSLGSVFIRDNSLAKEWEGLARCASNGTLVALYASDNNVDATVPVAMVSTDFIEASLFVAL